ncbi:MAG: hypothetical protein AB1640_17025 [bacterium]
MEPEEYAAAIEAAGIPAGEEVRHGHPAAGDRGPGDHGRGEHAH